MGSGRKERSPPKDILNDWADSIIFLYMIEIVSRESGFFQGDIVEIYGNSKTGKTEVCLFLGVTYIG